MINDTTIGKKTLSRVGDSLKTLIFTIRAYIETRVEFQAKIEAFKETPICMVFSNCFDGKHLVLSSYINGG